MFFVKNDGDNIIETNYWEGHFYSNQFLFLTKGDSQWRLLVPDNCYHMLDDIWVGKMAVIEKSRSEPGCIDILFPDDSETPFKISLDMGLVDKKITPGDFAMSIFSSKGLEITMDCHIKASQKQKCNQALTKN